MLLAQQPLIYETFEDHSYVVCRIWPYRICTTRLIDDLCMELRHGALYLYICETRLSAASE